MMSRDDSKGGGSDPLNPQRRAFLQASALLGLSGLGLLPGCEDGGDQVAAPGIAVPDGGPVIKKRSTLGRTGIEIPDISFGGWGLEAGKETLVQHALDRGVTHFDTAPDYADGGSEETIGKALEGNRQRVTLATKFQAKADATRTQIMDALESSLRRFRTDYVDIYFNHAVNEVARIRNPEWLEFVDLARKQGKIRASGMSGHSGRLTECVDAAIDDGQTDVFLLAHNYANEAGFRGMLQRFQDRLTGGFDMVAFQPELPRLLERAHAKNLGVMVMKTRRGARYNDLERFKTDGATNSQAAFRWVLQNPNIDGLIVTMGSKENIDIFVSVSGSGPPTLADTECLLEYEAQNAGLLCQPGCSACVDACPASVDIAGTLRTQMYAERYGRPDIARKEYAALGAPALPCLTCISPVCVSACPAGIDIPGVNRETHRQLT